MSVLSTATRQSLGKSSRVQYPESDGQPMAENETQLFIMLALIAHLRAKFGGPNAHVGGDMFWYPVEGQPTIVRAPDVFVAFGRPQDPKRRTWKTWEEAGKGLDLVVEVISPSNTWVELMRLLQFYDEYGVQEYVVLDPERGTVDVFRRFGEQSSLRPVPDADGIAELIGMRFVPADGEIDLIDLDLGRVLEPHELHALAAAETARANAEAERANAEAERANAETRRGEAAEARVAALEDRLRELGELP